MKVKEERRN